MHIWGPKGGFKAQTKYSYSEIFRRYNSQASYFLVFLPPCLSLNVVVTIVRALETVGSHTLNLTRVARQSPLVQVDVSLGRCPSKPFSISYNLGFGSSGSLDTCSPHISGLYSLPLFADPPILACLGLFLVLLLKAEPARAS